MLKASPKKFKNEEVKGIISGTFASAMGNKVKKKEKEQYRRKSITIIYQDPCSQCQLKKIEEKKLKQINPLVTEDYGFVVDWKKTEVHHSVYFFFFFLRIFRGLIGSHKSYFSTKALRDYFFAPVAVFLNVHSSLAGSEMVSRKRDFFFPPRKWKTLDFI